MAGTREDVNLVATTDQCLAEVGDVGGHDATRHRVDRLPGQHADREPQTAGNGHPVDAVLFALPGDGPWLTMKSSQVCNRQG